MTTDTTLILVNGSPAGQISPLDRGLAYGDGVFRTLRLESGEPVWWQDHLEKLAADCACLDLFMPARSEWEQDVAWVACRMPDAVLKLLVTRGPGPRGYRSPDQPLPCRVLIASPLPDFPDPVLASGATLRVCELRLGHQAQLAGVKHLNRLENVLARMEWTDPAIDEGLLLDQSGQLVSGVMSNLIIRRSGTWMTPLLDRCGVAGVARGRFMSRLTVLETRLDLDSVLAADTVLLCNSLIQLRWVAHFQGRSWARPDDFESLRSALCLSD